MPSYGVSDALAVTILALALMPWTSLMTKCMLYILKKTARWTFVYLIAALVVAFLQYSKTYVWIKGNVDLLISDTFNSFFKRATTWILTKMIGSQPGASPEL